MIEFQYVRWKNFLSTGNSWLEIRFTKNPTTLMIGDNGAGKSTILDVLCFGLFGKPFRDINKPQLTNSINEKNMMVEIQFCIGKTEYKVRRGLKPHVFEVFEDSKLIPQNASVRDYQKHLEKVILKLNYNSFTQIVILGSRKFIPFMQLPAHSRREIIEDLLDIRIFSSMNVLAKNDMNENKEQIRDLDTQISVEREKLKIQKEHWSSLYKEIESQKGEHFEELSTVQNKISEMKKELAEKQMVADSIAVSPEQRNGIQNKLKKLTGYQNKFNGKISKLHEESEFYSEKDHCPVCEQEIQEEFKNQKIEAFAIEVIELEKANEVLKDDIIRTNTELRDVLQRDSQHNDLQNEILTLNAMIQAEVSALSALNAKSEKVISQDKLNEQREILKRTSDVIDELNERKERMVHRREMLSEAIEALKDRGIKSQIIKEYIPVINTLVNKNLASMEFAIDFEFDENFNEIIKSRYRDEFSYGSFSDGQKMRIDLALLLAWRAISKMKNNANTNILILDEVFDASLDGYGCDDFLKLINELSHDTHIFIISHKGEVLQDRFNNTIRFELHKNFTRMVQGE